MPATDGDRESPLAAEDIDADFEGMNRVWDQWLPRGVAPARATVEAKLCEPEILVEMSVVAALP